jgi:hypothetical protein
VTIWEASCLYTSKIKLQHVTAPSALASSETSTTASGMPAASNRARVAGYAAAMMALSQPIALPFGFFWVVAIIFISPNRSASCSG